MADAHRIVDDFFPRAAALREAFERHLALPSAQRQVWEVARDGGGGSFLRANPLRLLPQTMVAELVVAVQSWAALELGLARAGMPELRLYAGGAREAPGNDVGDGLWTWCLWLARVGAGTGGELELAAPTAYWSTPRMLEKPGLSPPSLIVPGFNRFAAWDSRLLASVRPVSLALDPATGLVALRGHLHGDGVALAGALDLDAVRPLLRQAAHAAAQRWRAHGAWHGHLGVRLAVARDGRVADATALCDRLVPLGAASGPSSALVEEALATLRMLRFPPAADATRIHFAILTDAPA